MGVSRGAEFNWDLGVGSMSPTRLHLVGLIPQQLNVIFGGGGRGTHPAAEEALLCSGLLGAGSPPGLGSEGSVQGRCLSPPAAWKAPHVQAPRSRLRRFPAMNWASESEPPARLRSKRTAREAGDGRSPRSAQPARVRARRRPPRLTVSGSAPPPALSRLLRPRSRSTTGCVFGPGA